MESWDLHSQETGLKMFHGDTRIGGWDRRKHHLFILESYVRKLRIKQRPAMSSDSSGSNCASNRQAISGGASLRPSSEASRTP